MRPLRFLPSVLTLALAGAAAAMPASTDELPNMPNVNGSNPSAFGSSRLDILKAEGIPVLETSHQEAPRSGQAGISGYRRVAADAWLGMGGLDSCVGLVILWKEGERTQAIVSHFNVEHDPKATLDQYEAKYGLFIPAGAVAYLAGGEESSESLSLLKGVIAALKAKKARISSYHPYSSMWVSEKGLLAYSFDRKSIYAGGYVSEAGREAMNARQQEVTARFDEAVKKSQDAARAARAAAAGGE